MDAGGDFADELEQGTLVLVQHAVAVDPRDQPARLGLVDPLAVRRRVGLGGLYL